MVDSRSGDGDFGVFIAYLKKHKAEEETFAR
jgi:hypothetical protein